MFGASGTIGFATAKALLADGHAVTCVLRRSASALAVQAELDAAGAQCRIGEPGSDLAVEHFRLRDFLPRLA